MLRRNFVKTATLALGGFFVLFNIPLAGMKSEYRSVSGNKRRILPFHGHARSGCATRPELALMLEDGITALPF